MIKVIYIGLILISLALLGCVKQNVEPSVEEKKAQIQAYITKNNLNAQQTPKGTYYILLSASGSNRAPQKGEQITISFAAKYLDDTPVSNTTGTTRLPFGAEYINKDFEDALTYLKEGDSARVFITSNPVIAYNFKIKSIRSESEQITKFKTDSSFTTTVTSSGLQYIITSPGTGDAPTLGKAVRVKYTLYDLAGNQLDESSPAGSTFNLTKGQLIDGFIEATLLLKPGGKGKFIMPSSIAYGTNPNSSTILPYMPLYFQIELVGIF